MVQDHLDHAGLVRLLGLERPRRGRHLRALADEVRHRGDRARVEERLVALDVQVGIGGHRARGLGDPLGPVARVPRHHGAEAGGGDGLGDTRVVGRNRDLVDPFGASGALADAHDQRRAAQVDEGFSRQPLGRIARGDECCEAHVAL